MYGIVRSTIRSRVHMIARPSLWVSVVVSALVLVTAGCGEALVPQDSVGGSASVTAQTPSSPTVEATTSSLATLPSTPSVSVVESDSVRPVQMLPAESMSAGVEPGPLVGAQAVRGEAALEDGTVSIPVAFLIDADGSYRVEVGTVRNELFAYDASTMTAQMWSDDVGGAIVDGVAPFGPFEFGSPLHTYLRMQYRAASFLVDMSPMMFSDVSALEAILPAVDADGSETPGGPVRFVVDATTRMPLLVDDGVVRFSVRALVYMDSADRSLYSLGLDSAATSLAFHVSHGFTPIDTETASSVFPGAVSSRLPGGYVLSAAYADAQGRTVLVYRRRGFDTVTIASAPVDLADIYDGDLYPPSGQAEATDIPNVTVVTGPPGHILMRAGNSVITINGTERNLMLETAKLIADTHQRTDPQS